MIKNLYKERKRNRQKKYIYEKSINTKVRYKQNSNIYQVDIYTLKRVYIKKNIEKRERKKKEIYIQREYKIEIYIKEI